MNPQPLESDSLRFLVSLFMTICLSDHQYNEIGELIINLQIFLEQTALI